MSLISKVEQEITNYLSGEIDITPDISFNQYDTIKRIMLFQNCQYPTGNKDSLGKYKYYLDIISSRVDTEVKNIDLDTKDIFLWTDKPEQATKVFLANSELREYLKNTNQAILLNDIVETYSGLGNIVLKKVKEGYELFQPLNFFITNQAAKTLDDSAVIERHNLTATQLREKRNVWDSEAVDYALDNCGNKGFEITEQESATEDTENIYYEIYERNGEITVAEYKEAKGLTPAEGDDERYMLAKVIFAGLTKDSSTGQKVLFCEGFNKMSDVYVEAHRGRYEGRWWRKGVYELLFDIQIEANAIGNYVIRALEFGAKQWFWSPDNLVHQNILTDMQQGDIVKASNIGRIPSEMRDISSYIAKWNLLMSLADKLTNSYEVAQGESLPSGTPFRLGAMLNINANKLFDFLREKLGLALQQAYQNWIIPDLLKQLKTKEILRLTDDPEYMVKYKQMLVDSWYVLNLPSLPVHTPEMADILKQGVMEKLNKQDEFYIGLENGMWKEFKPTLTVVITGENVNIQVENQKYLTFIPLEPDPRRRSALVEKLYAINGVDISGFPKTPEEQMMQPVSAPAPRVPMATQREGVV